MYERVDYVPQGFGRVYLYRRDDLLNGGGWFNRVFVSADGKWITSLRHGGYFQYLAMPGELEIRIRAFPVLWMTDAITLDVQDQRIHFVGIEAANEVYEIVPATGDDDMRTSRLQQ